MKARIIPERKSAWMVCKLLKGGSFLDQQWRSKPFGFSNFPTAYLDDRLEVLTELP
jgi:hypothetical protein